MRDRPTRDREWRTAGVERPGALDRLRDWAMVEEAVEPDADGPYRLAALVALAVVTGAYLSTLWGVVSVVGGQLSFLAVTSAALGLGLLLGATLRRPVAVGVALGVLLVGLLVYLVALPPEVRATVTIADIVTDTLAMLTGFSAVRLVEAGLWATVVAPAPTFLVWFFGIRGEHGPAATVAGLTLGFFVLTGDAGPTVTLVGVVAAAAVVGFGTLARLDAGRDQIEVLAATFAVVILASATVSAVPGGGASPLRIGSGSVQNELVSADDSVGVGGSLAQSPDVRFVVTADRKRYWRVAPYDRFTGSRWVQTGTGSRSVDGPLPEPPGEREHLNQSVTAHSPLRVLPAAATPHRLSGVDAVSDSLGALRPTDTVRPGERYAVTSLVSTAPDTALARAGTAYPTEIATRYTQTPANTPAGVSDLAANVTATASNPYESALAVERWLEANKGYSLSVPEPRDNIAGQFLYEMEAGYCVYFASTMVTMLRSQDVPSRYVVGYTSGQRVDEDTYVVRGYDAHAWVEVYFPGVGWRRFDPTPVDPRRAEERTLLEQARAAGDPDVDAAGSENGTYRPTTVVTPNSPFPNATVPQQTAGQTIPERFRPPDYGQVTPIPGANNSSNATMGTPDPQTVARPADGGGAGDPLRVPALETLALWSLLVVGLAAGARRSGAAERAYRAAWVRIQPRDDDPMAAIEGAFDRAMYVLGRRVRPREDGETVRAYVDAIDADERVRELVAIRERARYGGEVSPGAAERARSLAAAIVRDE